MTAHFKTVGELVDWKAAGANREQLFPATRVNI